MAARLYSEVLASRSSGQRYKERLDPLPCLLLHSLTPIAKDKRQPYHMKAQASYILFTAALLGFAKAGWETPTRTLNYNAFCGRRPHPPAGVGYVCLQAKYNAEGFTRESDFRGFLQPGKQNFVLYDGNPTTKTAVWENNNVHVTVMFQSGSTCAAVDIQDRHGNDLRNSMYCGKGAPISIDP
ncbi:uncharacterized protein UDID_01952 [Ustilago sp. UG-2017a]|nr:uncharacterized protein UDID_01952 [Ustilago sp. UG-2017a]